MGSPFVAASPISLPTLLRDVTQCDFSCKCVVACTRAFLLKLLAGERQGEFIHDIITTSTTSTTAERVGVGGMNLVQKSS